MSTLPLLTRREFEVFLRTAQADTSPSEAASPPEGRGKSAGEETYPFELDDLYFLYSLTRQNAAVSVMEFGSGWSTLAFAKAINENRLSMGDAYQVRHPNPFRLMSVEVSEHWMDVTLGRLPIELRDSVISQVTTARLIDFHGSYATAYSEIPAFTPDIIYLDGPDAEQVTGSIDGFASIKRHGLPMSADILRIEPHLWPWTVIVTDGRTANARFLKANLRRNWQHLHDPFGDRTVFRLDETPFGAVTEEHIATRLKIAREVFQKQEPYPV
jgi:hypothetical protein